jgi:hypothetical protein
MATFDMADAVAGSLGSATAAKHSLESVIRGRATSALVID